MQASDWQIPERLTRIRRAYTLMGHGVSYQTHYVSCSFGRVPFGSTAETELIAPADGPYVWAGTMAFTVPDSLILSDPREVFVSFTLTKNERKLMAGNVPTPGQADGFQLLPNIAGTGARPHFWNFPIILKRRDRVRVVLVNRFNSTLGPQDLDSAHIVLYGFRLMVLSLADAGELS